MTTPGDFYEMVLQLAMEFGGSFTSGRRTTARNNTVGGVPTSWHLTGYAHDVVLDDWSRKAQFMERAARMGVKVVDEVDTKQHLHCQAF